MLESIVLVWERGTTHGGGLLRTPKCIHHGVKDTAVVNELLALQ